MIDSIALDLSAAVREATDDDHFYGAWIGGKASSGGHPAGTDRFADFPASQALRKDVTSWPDTKPWEMTDEELRAGKAPGIVVGGERGYASSDSHPIGGAVVAHAGYNTDRNISLTPSSMGTGGRMSETPQERSNRLMSLMYHEAGHRTSVDYNDLKPVLDQYKTGTNAWRVPGLMTSHGDGIITAATLSEDIAETYATAMMYGNRDLEGGAKAFTDAVVAAAGRNGYPTSAYTAEHFGPMSNRQVRFVRRVP